MSPKYFPLSALQLSFLEMLDMDVLRFESREQLRNCLHRLLWWLVWCAHLGMVNVLVGAGGLSVSLSQPEDL